MPVKGKKKKPHAAEGIVGKYIKKETPTVIPRCKFIDCDNPLFMFDNRSDAPKLSILLSLLHVGLLNEKTQP